MWRHLVNPFVIVPQQIDRRREEINSHMLRGSAALITATSVSYGKMGTLTPCKIETLEQIDTQFVRIDYVHERSVCSKFGKINPFTGDFWAKG